MDDDLISDFLTETNESIADLDVALVKLERTPDDKETLSLIFRLVHTIKGTCGFLGLPRLEHVAHAGENVLGKIRDGVLTATPDTVTLVLAGLDRIKLMSTAWRPPAASPPEMTANWSVPLMRRRRDKRPSRPQWRQWPRRPNRSRSTSQTSRTCRSRRRPRQSSRRSRHRHKPPRRLRRANRSSPTRPSGLPWTCWKT